MTRQGRCGAATAEGPHADTTYDLPEVNISVLLDPSDHAATFC